LSLRAWIASGVAVVLMLFAATALFGLDRGADSVMVVEVSARPFMALIVERGNIMAAETEVYAAPRMRWSRESGQILEMAPEGSIVQAGDMVIRFDSAALLDAIRAQEQDVLEEEADLRKTLAEQDSRMASLVASLEMTQFSFEKAKLNLEKMEFEAEVRKRQEEISYKKSEMSLVRAQEAIESQKRVDAVAIRRLESSLARERSDLEGMKSELANTVLYARQPGLIVYEKSWGASGQTKVKVGDTPYSGQTIITIPNLEKMIIKLSISEMDIHRMAREQQALVVVDAYPDTIYQAVVTDVSPLARRMGISQVKVFDCTVTQGDRYKAPSGHECPGQHHHGLCGAGRADPARSGLSPGRADNRLPSGRLLPGDSGGARSGEPELRDRGVGPGRRRPGRIARSLRPAALDHNRRGRRPDGSTLHGSLRRGTGADHDGGRRPRRRRSHGGPGVPLSRSGFRAAADGGALRRLYIESS
jgi:multidrug efflux pump subunit AcrA (membrane-fusion protein)